MDVEVHPRTIQRWELGQTQPDAREWARLAVAIARYAPDAGMELAQLVGAPPPFAPPPAVDTRAIDDAILHAADHLDVAPGRVRAALREVAAAVARANGSLDDLARAAQERVGTGS